MLQVASLRATVMVKVAFIKPPPSFDLRYQALPSGEEVLGPSFRQLRLLGIIILPIFSGLVGYSAMRSTNSGDVGVLLDKPMETGLVKSPGHLP
ncbi:unnamed protein product [Prunus armeniaca]